MKPDSPEIINVLAELELKQRDLPCLEEPISDVTALFAERWFAKRFYDGVTPWIRTSQDCVAAMQAYIKFMRRMVFIIRQINRSSE